jgi:hypothetical protein
MTEKSKLPDLQEIASMTRKFFHGIKKSVEEIISDYKSKRSEHSKPSKTATKPRSGAKTTRAKKDASKD